MRTLFCVTVFLFLGIVSFAQDNSSEKKTLIQEKGFVFVQTLTDQELQKLHGQIANFRFESSKTNLVGIYKFRNAKIKRALAFKTKIDTPKLA